MVVPRGLARCAKGVALALAILCAGDAVAEPTSRDDREARPGPAEAREARTLSVASRAQLALGLSGEQLLPRIGAQLERLSAARNAVVPGSGPAEVFLADEMSRSVRRGVERSTRQAVKGYLLETTELDQRLEIWKDALRRRHGGSDIALDGSTAGAIGEPGRVRFDIGLYHLRPQVEMRYDVGPGSLRFRLDTAGDVKLGYGGPRMGSTRLEASYDGDAILFGLGF